MDRNDDLKRARSSLAEAELARRPSDRYLAAHLAALRVVAIVLTHRAPPGRVGWMAARAMPGTCWQKSPPNSLSGRRSSQPPRASGMPSAPAPPPSLVHVRRMTSSGMPEPFFVWSSGQSDSVQCCERPVDVASG